MRRPIVLGLAAVPAPSAGAKLPPVDARAPVTVPIGAAVPLRLWFVDRTGEALPAAEVGGWNLPRSVGG